MDTLTTEKDRSQDEFDKAVLTRIFEAWADTLDQTFDTILERWADNFDWDKILFALGSPSQFAVWLGFFPTSAIAVLLDVPTSLWNEVLRIIALELADGINIPKVLRQRVMTLEDVAKLLILFMVDVFMTAATGVNAETRLAIALRRKIKLGETLGKLRRLKMPVTIVSLLKTLIEKAIIQTFKVCGMCFVIVGLLVLKRVIEDPQSDFWQFALKQTNPKVQDTHLGRRRVRLDTTSE